MGVENIKCNCACKDFTSTAKFEKDSSKNNIANGENINPEIKTQLNPNLIGFDLIPTSDQKDLRKYVATKSSKNEHFKHTLPTKTGQQSSTISSSKVTNNKSLNYRDNTPNNNVTTSNMSVAARNHSFLKSNKFESSMNKIIKAQSSFRGYYQRKSFSMFNKSKYQDETNQLIKELTEQYTTLNLKKAEALIGTKFDKDWWKSVYNNSSNNKSNNNYPLIEEFTYNFGKTYNSQLLILSYYIPSFYIGNVNIKNKPHSYGVLLQSNGTKYEGFWRDGQFTGWGRYIDNEGNLFEGYFHNGLLNSKGMKRSWNGNTYIGDFVDNLKEGKGKEETNDHIYNGEFKKDKKNGKGKWVYKLLKDAYEGEFLDNWITGFGFYSWENNDTYKGTFVNGKMHGKGLYRWPDGREYYGDYINNIKEGNGIFKWTNGKIFEGQFKKGKPSGFGKWKTGDREVEVEFREGKLITNIRDFVKKNTAEA